MNNINLPKIKTRGRKRLGQGYGSGKGGHTVGRGQKGQKSRKNLGILFEGVKMKKSFVKRLPLRRGKSKFSSRKKPLIIKTKYLNILPVGSSVDIELLVNHGIVDKKDAQKYGVKILGDGEISKRLNILVPISNSAAKLVEKAGGKVIGKSEKG